MVSPPDAAKSAGIAGPGTPSIAAKAEERAAPGVRVPPAMADRADIRPLDLEGALQILISEVRAELDAALLSMGENPPPPATQVRSVQEAVKSLVDGLLNAYLREPQDFAAFDRAVSRIESAWQSGSARGLTFVGAWKQVPQSVVDTVRQVIAGAAEAIDAETMNPLWLNPEWAALAPRFARYRRRRQRLRRWLNDPDFKLAPLEEESEPPR